MEPSSEPSSTEPDLREIASARLQQIADASAPPVSIAVTALARFARAEWPETDELSGVVAAAEDLARLEQESNATLDDAVAQMTQAEAARAFAKASLEQMINATEAPASFDVGALRDRVCALEALLHGFGTRSDRLVQDLVAQKRENVEIRSKLINAEAERSGLQRRLDKVEYELDHVHKILEAAAGFAQAGGTAS
jgi:hypothetical protein